MGDRSIRERSELLLQDVVVPVPLDWNAFAETVSRHRKRPIKVAPKQTNEGPSGWLLAMASLDVVLYEPQTSKVHQDHIIAHEFAHALWCHTLREHPGLADALGLLFPHIDPGSAITALGRDGYTAQEELEAETMAALILERARRPPEELQASGDAEVVGRLTRTLGGRSD